MNGINKVIVLGNLGTDPEHKVLPSGGSVTNISVATSEKWTDKQTGQTQERTEWHRIVFFGRLAEIVAEYLRKGSKIYVEGSLRTRKWQAQDGSDRYTTEIVAKEMQMLGGGIGLMKMISLLIESLFDLWCSRDVKNRLRNETMLQVRRVQAALRVLQTQGDG